MARWLLPFDSTIDPVDPSREWTTGIHQRLYQSLQWNGHEAKLARIALVDDVLTRDGTKRIYKGWFRQGKDDCYVYVGTPDGDHRSLSIHTPPPPGMVFLVFVLPDGSIDDWNWRPAKKDTTEPEGVSGELIWPPIPESQIS